MSTGLVLFILGLLLIKHYIADWIMQTTRIALEKGTNASLLLLHSLHHIIGTAMVLIWFVEPFPLLLICISEFILHSVIDYVKSCPTMLGQYKYPTQQYFIWMGFDQLLHQLSYLAIVVFLMGM
jgi:hypothetical protein